MMKRALQAAAFTALTAVLLWNIPPAAGGETPGDPLKESKEYFQRGVILFGAGDTKGALENFLKSYDLRPHYKVKYNIGICYYSLGQYAEAANELEEFLLRSGEDVDAETEQKLLHILEEVRPKLGKIYFIVAVEGTEIVVDGKHAGVFPMQRPYYVLPGEHELHAMAPDGSEWSGKVAVDAGERKDIKIYFSNPAMKPWKDQDAAGRGAGKPGAGGTASAKSTKGGRRKVSKIYAYVALGLGGAAIVAAAVTGGLALKKSGELDDLDDECRAAGCTSDLDAHDDYEGRRSDVYDEARLTGNLCTGFIVAAGVLSAATVLLFVFSGPWKKERKGAGLSLVPATWGRGALLRFEF
jgi:tetratricopeptide (TPR) repeat protein